MISNRFLRSAVSALALLALLGAGANGTNGGGQVAAQGDSRTFPETGKTVKGDFLQYWNDHGGLAQQGYPISDEFQEKSDLDGNTYTVQYFERAVFERHPENQPPYDVLLSQLGKYQYNARYGAVTAAPSGQASTINPRLFPETGKTIGGKFRAYWESHGGLAQQGYPITNEFQETSLTDGKKYIVQYFERAVFEFHPENQPPYDVLLSLLGSFSFKAKYPGGITAAPQPIYSLQAYCLLGGSANGAWVQPEDMQDGVKGGEQYGLYSLTAKVGTATGGPAYSPDAPCPETRIIDFQNPPASAVMAVGGAWNALPRAPRVESNDQDVYQQAVAAVLKANGLPNATVDIKQIIRVDLEGDGENEVLISATHYANDGFPSTQAGDYSVLFLRQTVGSGVRTTILGSDFYTTTNEFAAPLTFSVQAVLDVNGDGRLEVIVDSHYYEGAGTSVVEVNGADVKEVLYCGCGA